MRPSHPEDTAILRDLMKSDSGLGAATFDQPGPGTSEELAEGLRLRELCAPRMAGGGRRCHKNSERAWSC